MRYIMWLIIKYNLNTRENIISRHQIKWSLLQRKCTKCFDDVEEKEKYHIKDTYGYRALSEVLDIDLLFLSVYKDDFWQRNWEVGFEGFEVIFWRDENGFYDVY
jgi:hypothetical protein